MRTPGVDAIESPALPLLFELGRQGCICRLTNEGELRVHHASKMTDDQAAMLKKFTLEIKELLRCDDDGVVERSAEFRRQISGSPKNSLPTFIFKTGLPYRRGECFSCAEPLEAFRISRCERCTLAMHLALWSEGYSPSPALLEARIA